MTIACRGKACIPPLDLPAPKNRGRIAACSCDHGQPPSEHASIATRADEQATGILEAANQQARPGSLSGYRRFTPDRIPSTKRRPKAASTIQHGTHPASIQPLHHHLFNRTESPFKALAIRRRFVGRRFARSCFQNPPAG